ncbi:MAG: hypothetical protein K0R66_871 [Gammaproteobacteria bacterium]|jgi:hypothetical protein|nr:hypothetical protein [Gammaproteobacteria bacterium]
MSFEFPYAYVTEELELTRNGIEDNCKQYKIKHNNDELVVIEDKHAQLFIETANVILKTSIYAGGENDHTDSLTGTGHIKDNQVELLFDKIQNTQEWVKENLHKKPFHKVEVTIQSTNDNAEEFCYAFHSTPYFWLGNLNERSEVNITCFIRKSNFDLIKKALIEAGDLGLLSIALNPNLYEDKDDFEPFHNPYKTFFMFVNDSSKGSIKWLSVKRKLISDITTCDEEEKENASISSQKQVPAPPENKGLIILNQLIIKLQSKMNWLITGVFIIAIISLFK